MSKEDPKPGRWILPLVVAGLIGFTYAFVNALPPAQVAVSTTTTTIAATTTTVPETTTTTLPPAVRSFLNQADVLVEDVVKLRADLDTANQAWEDRKETGVSFDATLEAFQDVHDRAAELSETVAATTPPPGYGEAWLRVVSTAADLVTASEDVVAGLRAPGVEKRRQAVIEFDATADALAEALRAVGSASTTTSTTTP